MEGPDKSLLLSEGMISADQTAIGSKSDQKRHCHNCNTELTDIYCPHCGQKDIPKRQTLGELLANFISSFWSYESKFFKTGQFLLFKPGFLAIEYTNGRRERYYHPARMYVFISFIYFLLFSALPDVNEDDVIKEPAEDIAYQGYGAAISIDSVEYQSFSQYDSIQQTLPEVERDGSFLRFLREREIALINKYEKDGEIFTRDFASSFTANFPKIFFLLLPVFALVLKLLYLRRDFFYSEHLVFSIYFYNFFFLAGSLYMLFDLLPWLGWAATVVGFWIALYLLLAMKKMYGQKWGKTVLKYCVFFITFSVCVGIGLLVNLMITLMYI